MKDWGSYAAMILVQVAYGGSNILIKIALDKGLNQLVLVVYRHVIAMFVLFPFAYVLERRQRPSLSFPVMLKIFALSSLGTTVHLNVYYAGLRFISPTVASALSNVIPSLTFVIAVILRMEMVKIGNVRGQAKVVGTLLCIGGALMFTFWKGGVLLRAIVERPLIQIHGAKDAEVRHEKDDWIKGSSLILISHVAWSAWLILQAVVIKVYPARLSLNVLICFFASLQSFILALFFARSLSLWRLEWDVQLLTIVYCGSNSRVRRSGGIRGSVLLANMVHKHKRPCFRSNVHSVGGSICGSLLIDCFCRESSFSEPGGRSCYRRGSLLCALGEKFRYPKDRKGNGKQAGDSDGRQSAAGGVRLPRHCGTCEAEVLRSELLDLCAFISRNYRPSKYTLRCHRSIYSHIPCLINARNQILLDSPAACSC